MPYMQLVETLCWLRVGCELAAGWPLGLGRNVAVVAGKVTQYWVVQK